jgi:hypothetical protein
MDPVGSASSWRFRFQIGIILADPVQDPHPGPVDPEPDPDPYQFQPKEKLYFFLKNFNIFSKNFNILTTMTMARNINQCKLALL